jgi:hypothetical protein
LTINKSTDLAAHRSGSLVFADVTELQREVQVFGPVGITRAILHLVGEAGGESVEADLAYTRTRHRSDDAWVIVAAHGSVVPRRQ